MIRSTNAEWGWPAKLLHWLGAAFILVLLAHGWWMTHLAARPDRLANYGWHAAIGYDLMGLLVLRLLWRWAIPSLPCPAISSHGSAPPPISGISASMC